MALIAVHLGVVDESSIDEMSYLFFEDVIEELGHKLVYDAIVNYAGNSFCSDSWEMITDNNPLVSGNKGSNNKIQRDLLNFFESANVKVQKGVHNYGKENANTGNA